MTQQSRRHFLRAAAAMGGAGVLQACSSSTAPQTPVLPRPARPGFSSTQSGNHVLRVIACSGYAPRTERIDIGLRRLADAGFTLSNQQAAYRRYQRFAGSDAERIADFQEVATGRVATPKVLMGLRGGYGAGRLLPYIDWASLGSRMREHGTLFFGFSDVCAIQLALLAQGNMMSFAGPMVYSEFGKPQPSVYTLQSFIDATTRTSNTIYVAEPQSRSVHAEGVMWGGNLSVLTSLVGSPYMPDIRDGILFLEDVGEQPYRIERMLQTLHLAGILSKQQAIVMGNFRMGTIRDVYDSSYNFNHVIQTMSRVAKVPVLTGFPFGHITNKTTFPLGAHARIAPMGGGGYQVSFDNYPTLNADTLALNTLLPPPSFFTDNLGEVLTTPEDSSDLE